MTLHDQLHDIGLKAVSDELDDLLAHATKRRWSPAQLLEHVVELETKERARRSLERRLSRSRLGRFKPIADFDWNWPKKIDRPLVESCLRLDFIEPARNVVLVAPHGLGKSMIAKNIAHEAIKAGHSVIFTTASALLLDLASRESARTLDRRLKHYAGTGLLVVDEIGYLAYDNRNADLLFQLVNLRYEKKSIVFTTNLAFRDWPTIFPNATCATALIDRIVHHAEIVVIEGDSYRRREAEAEIKSRRRSRSAGPKKRTS
jgi:DNA replication protein DnaC